MKHAWANSAQRLDLDLSRPVGQLSKGNRQKIGLVLAFAPEARLFSSMSRLQGWTRCCNGSSRHWCVSPSRVVRVVAVQPCAVRTRGPR